MVASIAGTQGFARAQPAPQVDDPRGHFSWGRVVVETLAGAAIGGATAYLAYNATCDDDGGCIGPALLGLTANIVVTPLAVYGSGHLMGGRGTLGTTYFGGILPFAVTSGVSVQYPTAALGISIALMPIGSALLFELSSHAHSSPRPLQVGVAPAPTSTGGLGGAVVSVGGVF